MIDTDPQFARSEVLRIFNHYQVYLCLGSAITTVGLLSAGFFLLRRRRDPLLFWLALFAILYGARLILGYQLLFPLGLRPAFYQRLVIALGFLVPIPAFFFFREMNLIRRTGRFILALVIPIEIAIA